MVDGNSYCCIILFTEQPVAAIYQEITMLSLNDINTIEEVDFEPSAEEYFASLQRAINSGSAWSFQGSYGRAMMDAIEAGRCMLGKEPARDYWGNRIPARHEVKAGTKGSPEYVHNAYGADWADFIANV